MPDTLNSVQALSLRLGMTAGRLPAEIDASLETVGQKLEAVARSKFGTYQGAAGPFAAWAPLTVSTMLDRVRKGFTANDPLLRSGQTRDSTSHATGDGVLALGSTSKIMAYLEGGTDRMPARSVLGATMFEGSDDAAVALLSAIDTAFE